MDALCAHGVEHIFGNPGTTENPVLDRLIDYPQIRYNVALHEGIAVGAANFYALATGQTPVVNLHVAPGLGNAIGMLYGALKAAAPMIVTAGAQDTRMRLREPLLGHDLPSIAAPVTKWSTEPRHANEMAPTMARAFQLANTAPRGPVFVALPVDVMEQETSNGAYTTPLDRITAAAPESLDALAERLIAADRPAILAGDDAADGSAFEALQRLAETLGAPVFHDGLRSRLSFPNRHPHHRGRIPFESGSIRSLLAPYDCILLLGDTFFEEIWYDSDQPFADSQQILQLTPAAARIGCKFPIQLGIAADIGASLPQLSERVGAMQTTDNKSAAASRRDTLASEHHAAKAALEERVATLRTVSPTPPAFALHEIAASCPENVIVVDESITAYGDTAAHFDFRTADSYYAGRGGGIGQGLAGALGTQVAHPDRPVLCLSGDGSAMYSAQAFWTAAHHELPIVFVILANREYRVLKHNLDIYRARFDVPSNKPYPHMDLAAPTLDFVSLAASMGVSGEHVASAGDIGPAVERAFAARAPRLIEVVIAGKG